MITYLCGGTFFDLITLYKHQPKSAREHRQGKSDNALEAELFGVLVRMGDPSRDADYKSGSAETEITDYKTCRLERNGKYIPLKDDSYITKLKKSAESCYPLLLACMDEFISRYMDLSGEKKDQFGNSLINLIRYDSSTEDHKFLMDENEFLQRNSIINLNTVSISHLMLAIWYYIITEKIPNNPGKEAYPMVEPKLKKYHKELEKSETEILFTIQDSKLMELSEGDRELIDQYILGPPLEDQNRGVLTDSSHVLQLNKDLGFLKEVEFECLRCGNGSLIEAGGYNYKVVEIFPQDLNRRDQILFNSIHPAPIDYRLSTNHIAVCKSCGESYKNHPNINDYDALWQVKQRIIAKRATVHELQIDDEKNEDIYAGITKLICGLSSYDEDDTADKTELVMIAKNISAKVTDKNSSLLIKDLKAKVQEYYHFIRKFSQDQELDFTKVAKQIKTVSQKFEADGLTNAEVIDLLAGEVLRESGLTKSCYRIAAEVIVAFFVQNCEVLSYEDSK